jgi:SAM-dependent methyltransferase
LRAACLDDAVQNRCIDRVQRRLVTAALHHVEAEVPRGARLLDYGCGPGRWVRFFRSRDYQYSGVDLVEPMVELAQARFPGADIRQLDRDRIPHADSAFDLVVSIAVLHHNSYPEQQRILAELGRVLGPGGWLLLVEAIGRHAAPGAGECPRPLGEWVDLVEDLGLEYRWHWGARYGILAAAAEKLARGLERRVMLAQGVRALAGGSLLRRADALVDPWLLPFLPAKYCTRIALLASRPGRARLATTSPHPSVCTRGTAREPRDPRI